MSNILFISPTGTLDNGAEISIINLMKYLKKNGHTVFNAAPSYSKGQPKYEEENLKFGIDLKYIDCLKWWWEDAPGQVFGTDYERANSYRDAINKICQIIKENHIDIVISNTVNVFVGAVAAACCEVSHLWLIHEFPKNEFSYYEEKLDFINENSDELYTVVGQLEQTIKSLTKNVSLKTFAPYTEITSRTLIPAESSRIVSVGRITRGKNQLELIKAFEKIQNKKTELIFIGGSDEEYKSECISYIKKRNIKNISFLGHIDDPWSIVTDKDICVFTSSMESFGLVYVEAILNGIPTIISNNPGHLSAYQIIKAGYIYKLGDIDNLANRINAMLDNFNDELIISIEQKKDASELYLPEILYKQIIESIENSQYTPKPIRHLKALLTENEPKSKLAKFEFRSRIFFQKVRRKIFK